MSQTLPHPEPPRSAPARAGARVSGLLREAFAYLCASPHSRRRQMTQLHELDDRMLRDIGLTRHDLLHPPAKSGTNRTAEPVAPLPLARREIA